MNEYINIPKINYEGAYSKNPYAFKHYNKDEIIGGKKMSEHLKFSMAYFVFLGVIYGNKIMLLYWS